MAFEKGQKVRVLARRMAQAEGVVLDVIETAHDTLYEIGGGRGDELWNAVFSARELEAIAST